MDKIVRRVTVVERDGGSHHKAKVVYNSNDDEDGDDDDDEPNLKPLEKRVRRFLKAQVIQAQEAYQQHLDSASKGGSAWIQEGPRNIMRARRKAWRELRKDAPFKKRNDDEDEED